MRAVFSPSTAEGIVTAPPSKSMAHRLLLCAGLAQGESRISNLAQSQDVLATIDCLRALGAEVTLDGDTAAVRGTDPGSAPSAVLPCRECGSTLRFFLPLALLSGNEMTMTGSSTLLQRPMEVYETLASERGFVFRREPDRITVRGPLAPGRYRIRGDISSQFVSGLAFALPLLDSGSELELIPPVESRPYIDLTLTALRDFGAELTMEDNLIRIPGAQRLQPRDMTVEGDDSNAAFFAALNLLGGRVEISGLRPDSRQADRVFRDHFAALAAGCPEIDLRDCPDLGPVSMAAAAALHGAVFTGTRRLKDKESDRGNAMAEELEKLGITVICGENEIRVLPGTLRAPAAPLNGHNDHRIVMALSILLSRTGGVLNGAGAVSKSLPDFFSRLQKLGIEVHTDAMDQ